MTEPAALTPASFEIVVVRELRKAGLDIGTVRVHRRAELAEPDHGFVLELVIPIGGGGGAPVRRALVVCRVQVGGVARDVIESARARLADAPADVLIVFSTADFTADALSAAQDGGVALLRIVDGRTVYDASGWGDGTVDHYPAWLPAHTAQLVDRDAAGLPRLRLLEAGRPEMILDVLGSGTHG